jgi:hypothetical protein
MFPLSIGTWLYVGLGVIILALGIAVEVQTSRLDTVKTEYATFQATVKAEGDLAAKVAKETDAKNKLNKDKVDAQNKGLKADNVALTKRLRDSRASSSYVPSAPAGSTSPDAATVSRSELGTTLQRLDESVSGLIEEGDQAVIDLNSAKSWATQQ